MSKNLQKIIEQQQKQITVLKSKLTRERRLTKTLRARLKKDRPNLGKIRDIQNKIKKNANWLIPTLASIIVELIKNFL